jgi:2-isopropylmalate synthase
VNAKQDRIIIFDTTLRDGEQSPGATLTSSEKIDIARQLARLGIDVIEAGFPAASPDDLRGVQEIAEEVGTADGPIVAGLARCVRNDILKAWEGVQPAAKPRIHTFLSSSDIHLEHQLHISREKALDIVREMVTLARSLCDDVEFSPMDATRSDPEFVIAMCGIAIECGATTINVPDTVGYAMPDEFGSFIARLIDETPGGQDVIWSAHCHNDLGLAAANTLAAIKAGARQAEVTINGIGERAGNTALEEIVMALHTRPNYYEVMASGIDTTQIIRTSRMVANYTGLLIQRNKAVVGGNAFSHESGIHQDGVLKNALTYEIMTPETIGLKKSELVLGKHSGRHAFRVRLEEMGYAFDDEQINQAFRHFKELADKKKTVTDADLEAMIADEFYHAEELFSLIDMQVTCGRSGMPTATVKVRNPEGEEVVTAQVGVGPVDALFQAIDHVVHAHTGEPSPQLLEYYIAAVTEGTNAQGDVTVRIRPNGGSEDKRIFGGRSADPDVIVASGKAYIAAINKMLTVRQGSPEGKIRYTTPPIEQEKMERTN